MVVWEAGNIIVGYDAVGEIFDSNGLSVVGEFYLGSYTDAAQNKPDVAVLSDGDYITVWTQAGGDPGPRVDAQRYTPLGEEVGPLIHLSDFTEKKEDVSVAALDGGVFVVSWEEQDDIFGRVFGGDGAPLNPEFQVGLDAIGKIQRTPDVTGLAGGGFVVVWHSNDQDGEDWGSYGQAFSSTYQKIGSEFLVNTTTDLSQKWPSVAPLPDGGFIVVWEDYFGTGYNNHGDIKGQLFSDQGTKLGAEFLINSTTANTQGNPTLATLVNGNIIVVWETNGQSSGLAARMIDSSGIGIGDEFFPPVMSGSLKDPSIAAAVDGGFVIVWTTNAVIPGTYDLVVALRFDEQGNRIYH